MSYARFGWAGSDVYVYLDCGGYLTCCGCHLEPSGRAWFYSTDDMLAHLSEHRAEGDVVTDDTFADLQADRVDNDKWIADHKAVAQAKGQADA